jgi:hypothetical protein
MTATTATACEYAPCSQVIERAATGRPPRYCGPNCRQAAHRERVRLAEEAAARAARLASARATTRAAFPRAEGYVSSVGDLAAEAFRVMADDQSGRPVMWAAFRELHRCVDAFERVALEYQDAADEAAALAGHDRLPVT